MYFVLIGGSRSCHALELDEPSKDEPSECSSIFEFKFHKHHSAQSDKFSKEKSELEAQLDCKKKKLQEKQKKIFELQEKVSQMTCLETKVEEKTKRLEAFNKERDILERELVATRSELTGIKRTLGNL